MVFPAFKQRINFRRTEVTQKTVIDFSDLQKTEFDADKIEFNSFQEVRNMIHKGRNAEVRRGRNRLAQDSDVLGIEMYENDQANKLFALKKDGTDSKIVDISRVNGVQSDIVTGITGQGNFDGTSLRGIFYGLNTIDLIQVHDGIIANNAFLGTPTGIAQLITDDGSRLWAASDDSPEQLLYFSKLETGPVTTFNTGVSIELNRAGVANSKITKYTALVAAGRFIVACGDDRTEIHRIPDFGVSGLTTFDFSISTLLHEFENLGVSSQHAVKAVGPFIFIKPTDNILYRITIATGAIKEIRDDLGQMDELDFSEVALEYDRARNLLYIACKEKAKNNIVIAYNVQEGNFSFYDNLFPGHWASDRDNTYYFSSFGERIEDVFQEDQVTDQGFSINWSITSTATYADNAGHWKIADKVFFHVRVFEETILNYKFFADRAIKGFKGSSFSKDFLVPVGAAVMGPILPGFGVSPFGMAGFNFDAEETTEFLEQDTIIDAEFIRGEVQLSGSATNKFHLRGLGLFAKQTTRPLTRITFDQDNLL